MSDLVDRESSIEPTARPARVRASDADRHATVMLVQDGVARGLLTPGEGSDRMEAAYATIYLGDLEPLTEDLPPTTTTPQVPNWRTLLWMLAEKIRSVLVAIGGRSRRRRIVMVVVAVLMLAAILWFGAHLFGGGDGFERGGFDRGVRGAGSVDLPQGER